MTTVMFQVTKSKYKKLVAFLYTIRKRKIIFTVASKTIIYLGINLTKKVKNLYTENYKTLLKEIEEDTQNERYSLFMN